MAHQLEVPFTPGDVETLMTREWLATNGLGGYASSTFAGINTRRYHGYFIPCLPAPFGRMVVVPALAQEVSVERSPAVALDHASLRACRLDGLLPACDYAVGDGMVRRTIGMPHLHNSVFIEYRVVRGGPMRLRLTPYVTFRMHDRPIIDLDRPLAVTAGASDCTVALAPGVAPLTWGVGLGGRFVGQPGTAEFTYRVEQERGFDPHERLPSPGWFEVEIGPGDAATFVATVEGLDLARTEAAPIFERERQRIEGLLARAPAAARQGVAARLVLAADQFVVVPGSRLDEHALARAAGDEARTVVAGYHWFTDWGRDTMISLEGLTLATGRHGEAGAILRTFAHYVRHGLLPNLFPEGGRTALYHTCDATLWYFHAIDRYVQATGDRETLAALYPVLQSIVEHHVRGTDFGIGVDPRDGLLHAGAPGDQLTWMDAKVGDWVVTPRRGKPVEIQALWYNALELMAAWAEELGDPDPTQAAAWRDRAAQVSESFNRRFWYAEGGYLFDVVDGEEGDDASLRPNQVFALSLRHPVLARHRWTAVVDVVARELLTPVGLRSLAPGDPQYRPTYFGDLRARDAAYHQGTVWPWLIGHFVDAAIRVHGSRSAARALLRGFEPHLLEAGVGSISEVFDAESPHIPRGCIAQAWSVAEVLRAWLQTGP